MIDLGEMRKKEDRALKELESALRHLHICWHVRGAGSHARAIDDAYRYYLQLVVSDKRPELRDYVQRFWPNIYQWGKRLEVGILQRVMIAFDFKLQYFCRYVSGSELRLSSIPDASMPAPFAKLQSERAYLLG
ncbi:hypothetical protein, partial [Gemmatimonas sp.]|uniref:hypothetical protein n=1 Tax=Gemmatimonas sp. TaxID=1962908 RepID=UPI003F708811